MRAFVARIAPVFAAALLSTAFVPGAAAQCLGPDNLSNGPCCTQTQVNAPRLPNFQQDSLYICWKDCNVELIQTCRAAWSGPTPPEDCRNYAKRLRLKDGAGVVKWNARIKLRYSRTWIETDPNGNDHQVWRYLANGDMRPTAAAGPVPCPVPPCAAAHGQKVRYTGYVDYALDCAAGGLREFAWMLSHECDLIDHAPGFPRAGIFHPDRSYTFVGPAAGFVVGGVNPIETGTGTLEAVRRISRLPGTTIDTCEYEEQIQHTLQPIQQTCLCGPATAPALYSIAALTVSGLCGTTITTPLPGPLLPGFISKEIGSWSLPLSYPGLEFLRWNAGGYDYGDPCIGTVRKEVFFGVTTNRGWTAAQVPDPVNPGLPLPLLFIDQGNSLQGNLGTTMNRPYRSDHILNLNY
jgi:hypothetical protein